MRVRHVVRNIVIDAFDTLGFAWLYRAYFRRYGPLTRVIVFHDVADRAWFTQLIEKLSRETRILTPQEFIEGNRDSDRMNILLTFDDGYASWVTNVLPVLRAFNIQGLFFVNSGLLETAHDSNRVAHFMREQLMIRPREPLTWDGVELLIQSGHTIGGHGYAHLNFNAHDREAVRTDIATDKACIAHHLKTPLTEFAYPFGTRKEVGPVAVTQVREAGYLRGYTTTSRFARFNDPMMIPRMCIEDATSPDTLMKWIRGAYDLFVYMKF